MVGMWEYIKNNLLKSPNAVLNEYGDTKIYTYIEMLAEIEKMAEEIDISTLKGAKCIILCKQQIETVKALLLCWRLGMIAIPLSLNYGKEHCRNIMRMTEPDVAISDVLEVCEKFDTKISLKKNNLYLSKNARINSAAELQNIEIMMCTSGTTGVPKAIMFSADAIQKNVALISGYFTVDKTDTVLICRPIYHCAVLVGELLLALWMGANIVLYSGGYQPFIIANILTNSNITVMCGTPTIFKGLSDCLRHRKIKGRLNTIALSGEYLLAEYACVIRESFPDAKIFNVYGLTEAGPRVSYLPYQEFDEVPQSVGWPLPGVDIVIINAEQAVASPGEIGEVWVKTPTIMSGYYKQTSRAKFRDGWFDTGDIGTVDERRRLYILGRSDDMIIKAGMNIYPQEVEKRLLEISEIKEVVVYGKIVNGVEQIVADIVIDEKYSFESLYDIMQKLSQVLPDYMMPSNISIVDNLPRNASGKVVRPSKELRDLYDKV